MTPMMRMPALRQIHKIPEGPWWRRALCWWRTPVVYEVAEDFDLYIRPEPHGRAVWLRLPRGFRSDLASTPRISWLFGFRPDNPALCLAGLYHDFFYRFGWHMELVENQKDAYLHDRITRGKLYGDRMFCRMVAEFAHVKMPGYLAFAALSLFGWPAWQANAKYRAMAVDAENRRKNPLFTAALRGDYTDDHREPEEPAGE